MIVAAAFTMSASCLLLLARRARPQVALLAIAAIAACAGVATFDLFVEPSVAISVGLVTFVGPWLFVWLRDNYLRRIAFDAYVRQNISADHAGWFGKSGIALDSKNRKLILAGIKVQRIYGFEEIREWKSSFLFGGTTQLYGSADVDPINDLEWAGSDLDVRVRSSERSILFVRVRDVEHPEWQIGGLPEKQTIRWFDLLQEHVASERAQF